MSVENPEQDETVGQDESSNETPDKQNKLVTTQLFSLINEATVQPPVFVGPYSSWKGFTDMSREGYRRRYCGLWKVCFCAVFFKKKTKNNMATKGQQIQK